MSNMEALLDRLPTQQDLAAALPHLGAESEEASQENLVAATALQSRVRWLMGQVDAMVEDEAGDAKRIK